MMMSGFSDESKDPDYIVVCTFIDSHLLDAARRELRGALLPREQRLHFKSERPRRRGQLLRTMAGLKASAYVYVGTHRRHADSRRAALNALAGDALELGAERIVLETDDSVMASDRRILADRLRKVPDPFRYEHLRAKEEPLLWVSDAVAWCWQHPEWRTRVRPMIASVCEV